MGIFDKVPEESEIDCFMKDLMNRYRIKVNANEYFIMEAEFYYKYDANEKNDPTFKRERKAGEFFIHGYGFDICFNTENDKYGGVLIRAIQLANSNEKPIFGPVNCRNEIFNKSQICDGNTIYLNISIERGKNLEREIGSSMRILGPGKQDKKKERYVDIQLAQSGSYRKYIIKQIKDKGYYEKYTEEEIASILDPAKI